MFLDWSGASYICPLLLLLLSDDKEDQYLWEIISSKIYFYTFPLPCNRPHGRGGGGGGECSPHPHPQVPSSPSPTSHSNVGDCMEKEVQMGTGLQVPNALRSPPPPPVPSSPHPTPISTTTTPTTISNHASAHDRGDCVLNEIFICTRKSGVQT